MPLHRAHGGLAVMGVSLGRAPAVWWELSEY